MEKKVDEIVSMPLEKNNEEKKGSEKILTWPKMKILISVVYGNLFLGSCYSLMAPIFPAEAEKKKFSPASYGLVFGIYQLVMFLSSPVFGKLIPILKPGFMLKAGMLVSGVCNILFGFVEHIPSGIGFLVASMVLRSIDALGAASFLTASYTTLGNELPEVIGRAMSLTETAFALGLAGGPVLGGFLYELGGFYLPFTVIGMLLLAGTTVNMFLYKDNNNDVTTHTISAIKLLSDIDFVIDVLSIMTCFCTIGFNEASLEPHIRQFNMSPTIVGVIFLISGLTDALISPVFGYIAEKVSDAHYVTFFGSLLFITCFLIVGPVSFLKFPTTLWVVILSQFFMGTGMASEIVGCFTHGMKHTVERGFPNEVGTYSVISGILFSSACFGAFVGPSFGGYLIHSVGYIRATEIIVGMKAFVAFVTGTRLVYWYIKKRRKPQTENIP